MTYRRIFVALVVALVCMMCFACSALADALLLPADLTIIEAEAFRGDRSIKQVTLPDGLQEIRDSAFVGTSLTQISLPDSLTYIADNAFDGLKGLSVTATPGTYAYTWAAQKGYISVVPVEEIDLSEFADRSGTPWLYVPKGETYNLAEHIHVFPENATDQAMTYVSEDESIVSVDKQTGKLTITGIGFTKITIAANDGSGVTATLNISGKYPPVPSASAEVSNGNTVTICWEPVEEAESYVVWIYNNETQASETHDYTFADTALTFGGLSSNTEFRFEVWTSNKWAILSEEDASCYVGYFTTSEPTEIIPVEKITFYDNMPHGHVGSRLNLNGYVTVSPVTATNKALTWAISDSSKASIDANTGIVWGLYPGATRITATAADGSGVTSSFDLLVAATSPQGVTATAGDTYITVEWEPVPGATSYVIGIYETEKGSRYQTREYTDDDSCVYEIAYLTLDTTYSLMVYARTEINVYPYYINGSISNYIQCTTMSNEIIDD